LGGLKNVTINKSLKQKKEQLSQAFVVTTGPDYEHGKPYVGDFDVIDTSVMEQYAFKHSQQLEEDDEYWADFRQPKYDPKDLAKLLEYNVWHKKAVDALAQDSMGRGWTLQKRPDLTYEPSEKQKNKAKTWIHNLTTNINTLFHDTVYDRKSLAVGAIELIRKDRSDSEPVDLRHMSVQYYRVHKDKVRVKQRVGTKEKWFILYGRNKDESGNWYDVHAQTGQKHPYNSLPPEERANEIIWFKEYAPQDKYYGLANIVPALNAIYGDLGRNKYNISFFKNRGIPALLITITGDFQDYTVPEYIDDGEGHQIPNPEYDASKTLKSQVREMTKQVLKNPQSTMVITAPSSEVDSNVEIRVEKLDTDVNDASFRLYRIDNREEVAVADGVPLERLGVAVTGQLNGSVAEELGDTYADIVIPGLMQENEETINKLFKEELGITDWIFKLDTFRKKDARKELDMGVIVLEHGGLTLGEFATYFGKQFGAEIPNIPLMKYRIVCGQLVDDMGYPVQQGVSAEADAFLEGLETELVGEAEEIENNNKTRITGEGQSSFDGFENISNKKAPNSLEQTIRGAFNSRR
jgi:capsid portal protein